MGRGDQLRGRSTQCDQIPAWRRCHRRHHLFALYQRRSLRGPEDGPRGVWYQQCRYLCTGVPLAHGLRLEANLWHQCRHAGFRLGGAVRRHHGDRRQPHRCSPCVRLAHEAPAARGCGFNRDRSAFDRPGALAAHSGGTSPAADARHQRGGAQCHFTCGGHRRPHGRRLCLRAL